MVENMDFNFSKQIPLPEYEYSLLFYTTISAKITKEETMHNQNMPKCIENYCYFLYYNEKLL